MEEKTTTQTPMEEKREAVRNEVLNFKSIFVEKVIATLSAKTKLPLQNMIQTCENQGEKDWKKMSLKGKIVRRFSHGEIPLIKMKIEFYENNTFSIFLNGNGAPSKEEKITIAQLNKKVVAKIKKHMSD